MALLFFAREPEALAFFAAGLAPLDLEAGRYKETNENKVTRGGRGPCFTLLGTCIFIGGFFRIFLVVVYIVHGGGEVLTGFLVRLCCLQFDVIWIVVNRVWPG